MEKILNILKALTFVFFISTLSSAEEYSKINKNTELSFYTGMFDYSDQGKKSTLLSNMISQNFSISYKMSIYISRYV